MLHRLNPFRGLSNPREVWAWGMYDLANQSFTLLINTLLFAVYFKEVVVGTETPERAATADRLWSGIVAASMLTVVVVSPFLGALADGRGWKKKMLIGSGLVCVAFTCSFGFIGPGEVALGIALYVAANIAYQIGENFMASFLPEVANPRNIGRVSAIGWTMGYGGALLLLGISIGSIEVFGLDTTTQWRPLLVFAGLWFLTGMIAPAIILRERPPVGSAAERSASQEAVARLRNTLQSARQYRELVRYLTAFFIYGMGVQAVIFFAAIVAKDVVFTDPLTGSTKLTYFFLLLTVTAGLAAILTSRFQDRIGAKPTVLIYLGVWIVSTLAFAIFMTLRSPGDPPPEWLFWIVGNGVGFGLGGIGTASRAMVGRFTPEHKTAEFFGLWGTVYKLAAVVGVFTFGQVKAGLGDAASLILLAGFFLIGAVMTLRINERRGVRAAIRAWRDVRRENEGVR